MGDTVRVINSIPLPSDSPLDAPTHRGDRVRVLGPGTPRLLTFVPAAFTPVCGDEVESLAQLAQSADQVRVQLMVVSCDAPASLAAWLKAIDPSGLLVGVSDHWPHGEIARACSAFDGELGTAVRHTWAVRADGSRMLIAACGQGEQRSTGMHARGLEWASGQN